MTSRLSLLLCSSPLSMKPATAGKKTTTDKKQKLPDEADTVPDVDALMPPSTLDVPAAASSPAAVSTLNGEELVSLLLRSFELTEESVAKLRREKIDHQTLVRLSEVR